MANKLFVVAKTKKIAEEYVNKEYDGELEIFFIVNPDPTEPYFIRGDIALTVTEKAIRKEQSDAKRRLDNSLKKTERERMKAIRKSFFRYIICDSCGEDIYGDGVETYFEDSEDKKNICEECDWKAWNT